MFPESISIIVKGVTYSIPTSIWNAASSTFNQNYKPGVCVKTLCRKIGDDLMPASVCDPFSSRRLAHCLMSVKGRAGGKKQAALRRQTTPDLFGQ